MGREIDPEKLLTMIRSILPSTEPGIARDAKASENRSVRREVRATLHNDDLEFTKRDVRRDSQHAATVMQRRGADKLNHFMRWCEKLTAGADSCLREDMRATKVWPGSGSRIRG